MRIDIDEFKRIKNTDMQVEADALREYLINLYGDPNYEEKDKAYIEATDPATDPNILNGYMQRGGMLVEELIKLSGLTKFEELKKHFTGLEDGLSIAPGESRRTIGDINKTCATICYKLDNLVNKQGEPVPYQLKVALHVATLNACRAGALTNVQNILSSISDPLYGYKYSFIQTLANEFAVARNAMSNVHTVNGLIDGLKEFGVSIPRDIYVALSPSAEELEFREQFRAHLEERLSGREGAYRFVEFLAQHYTGNLPDAPSRRFVEFLKKHYAGNLPPDVPSDGIIMKDENNNDTTDVEQIKMVCDMLNLEMADLCVESSVEVYDKSSNVKKKIEVLRYKEDYVSIVEAAVTRGLITKGILKGSQLFENYEITIPTRRTFIKNKEGRSVPEVVPEKKVRYENLIVQSSGGWFLSSQNSGKFGIKDKILDTKILKGLTKDGQNFEDFLDGYLRNNLKENVKFHDALDALISEESNLNKESNIHEDSKKILMILEQKV